MFLFFSFVVTCFSMSKSRARFHVFMCCRIPFCRKRQLYPLIVYGVCKGTLFFCILWHFSQKNVVVCEYRPFVIYIRLQYFSLYRLL